jgi:anti-anti-sigma factor
MDLDVSFEFAVPVITIEGEVDHSGSERLMDVAAQALEDNEKRIIFDLTLCSYMDSGGFGVLIKLLNQVRPDGWVGVIGLSSDLLRTMDLLGLTTQANFRVLRPEHEVQAS